MRRYLLLLIRLIVGVFIIIGAAQTIANNNPVIAACGTINTTTFQCVINDVPLSLTDAPACMSDVSICCTDANECPEPPPPSCKNRGDICTPESEICEINDFFCDCALLPCLVAQRTCLAGGGCCREVQDDRVVFTCDSGEPTDDTEQCRCIFEEHPVDVITGCGVINPITLRCVINDVPLSLTDAPACMSDVSICCTDANECPEPPPPSCKNRGDICTPESEICEINDFFCDCAVPRSPCFVAPRTCLAGGGCCREVQDDRVVFTCDSGEPTEQTEQCRCIFEEHPSRIHSSLCDIAGLIGIDTAIGCIPFVDITKTTAFLINWGIGIGGGVALIVIVIAGFIIMSSAGDPKRLNLGKELLFAAISGLILLVFSVFVLRILGIKILGLF